MPFTGSHAAAVLPFMRTGLVPSALVIGSMAPDLPYYLPVPISQTATHSAVGVLTTDVALAIVCFAVWHVLLAPFVVAVAPRGLRARLAPRYPRPWRRHVETPAAAGLVLVSLLVGGATHVAWDEFTHAGRWGTANVDWLAATHGPLAGYRWAQYASGIVGGLAIAWAAAAWWRRTRPMPDLTAQRSPALDRRTARLIWSAVGGTATVAGFGGLAHALLSDDGLRQGLYRAATWGGGAGLLVALACAASCWKQLQPQSAARRAGTVSG